MLKSPALALLLAVSVTATAIATPRALSMRQLGEGSLLGVIGSTMQLQHEVATHSRLLATATEQLGLTHADFVAIRQSIEYGDARYVEIPRHLEAMAGQYNGVPFIDRDVIIPAGVHGWEVDLEQPGGLLRVFLPNACGNISYLRVPKRFRVAAVHYEAPPPPPVVTPPPPTPNPVAIATAEPIAVVPAAPVVAASHLGWLPFLVLPLIFFAIGHGHNTHFPMPHHGVPVPGTPPPPQPTPTPYHGCP